MNSERSIGKYTAVDAPKIKQRTIALGLWQVDVFRFENTLGKTLTLALSRNRKSKKTKAA